MDDKFINLLSTRFGDVTSATDISDIMCWSELVRGSQLRLADTLVKYNNKIDNPIPADYGFRIRRRKTQPMKTTLNPSLSRKSEQGMIVF